MLCALGRRARLTGYGLEELGIPTGATVTTNAFLQTNYPNIYAAGDVAGPFQFTHTAAHQAWYAAVNALFGNLRAFKVDDRVIPAPPSPNRRWPPWGSPKPTPRSRPSPWT